LCETYTLTRAMIRHAVRTATFLTAALLCVSAVLRAQPHSTGMEISPFRVGLTYAHDSRPIITSDPNSNVSKTLTATHIMSFGVDYTGPLMQRDKYPGYYADYSLDFTVFEQARRDMVINILVGPGVNLGYASDITSVNGFFFGAMADTRVQFTFREMPVSLGLILKPSIGLHVYKGMNGTNMGIYKHGLMNSCLPQASISYRFGHQEFIERAEYDGEPRREYEYNYPLITFGLEWGYIAQHHAYSHFNYIADGGYRMDFSDKKLTYKTNAQIMAHFGFNVSKHLNLALYGGYQGLTRQQRIFPLALRTTVLFGQPEDRGRWLTYAGAGIGFKGSEKMFKNALIGHGGFGYRLSLTRETKLDFLCAFQGTYWHPDTFSESIKVLRSDEILLGLNFGIGISF